MNSLASSRTALIYAPNTTGKTRLAQQLKERDPERVILYNSFVEDVFTWDNERVVLKMNPASELLRKPSLPKALTAILSITSKLSRAAELNQGADFESGRLGLVYTKVTTVRRKASRYLEPRKAYLFGASITPF